MDGVFASLFLCLERIDLECIIVGFSCTRDDEAGKTPRVTEAEYIFVGTENTLRYRLSPDDGPHVGTLDLGHKRFCRPDIDMWTGADSQQPPLRNRDRRGWPMGKIGMHGGIG